MSGGSFAVCAMSFDAFGPKSFKFPQAGCVVLGGGKMQISESNGIEIFSSERDESKARTTQ